MHNLQVFNSVHATHTFVKYHLPVTFHCLEPVKPVTHMEAHVWDIETLYGGFNPSGVLSPNGRAMLGLDHHPSK